MSTDLPGRTALWVSWSSGKDSTFALQAAREDPSLAVEGLLVTVNADADRVAMHAVRRELVEAQAARLGLALHVVELPYPCPNDVYEERMAAAMSAAATAGVRGVVFGDLFLEDVRAYREAALAPTGIVPLFPLWHRDTRQLAREMIASGVRAVLTCVDPCGENGEFHTFVWDGPGFEAPIGIETADIVERGGFVFCDVVPRGQPVSSG